MDASYYGTSNALITTDSEQKSDWVLDSIATSHITNDSSQLITSQPYYGAKQVAIGNGDLLPNQSSGQVLLPTPNKLLRQNSLLLVSSISHNLISI